jgi:hypothetical protein
LIADSSSCEFHCLMKQGQSRRTSSQRLIDAITAKGLAEIQRGQRW